MKRTLIFLLVAGLGVLALLHFGGGFSLSARPHDGAAPPLRPDQPPTRLESEHTLPVPTIPVRVPAAHGVMIPAEAEALTWQDRVTGEVIEVPFFFRWRFITAEVRGLQPQDADRQGALCLEPVLEVYRDPQTREEADALRLGESGAQEALLSHRFSAEEALALGHIAQRLEKRTQGAEAASKAPTPDNTIHLRGRVRVLDLARGLEIEATDLTVFPREERAEGAGLVTLRHQAFVLEGQGISIDRDSDRGWSRVELHRRVVLRIREQAVGPGGEAVMHFAEGGLRPTHVTADGRAVVVHEKSRREQILRVSFSDGVRVEETAGGSLDARQLALELFRVDHALASAEAQAQWQLRELTADGDVRMAWPPDQTRMGGLTSGHTQRLVHTIAQGEAPTTVLEGRTSFLLLGQDLLGGVSGGDTSRLRISCEERAWMGPMPRGALDPALDPQRLRRLMLRGTARIERQVLSVSASEDLLEADEMEFVVYDLPPVAKVPGAESPAQRSVPVRFTATKNVRLGGSRMRGQTHRLVAEQLHTERPVLFAEGPSSEIYFLDLGGQERLLGAPREDAQAREKTRTAARWHVERMLARGRVRVDTSLGGPSLGIPVRVTCEEAGYERVTGLARLAGTSGAPARVSSATRDGRDNLVHATLLTLDRYNGILTARGAVHSELYLAWQPGRGRAPQPMVLRADPGLASELGVKTSSRIEVLLARQPGATGPGIGLSQVLRIHGALRAELRGPENTMDVLEADGLDVSLIYDAPNAAELGAPTAPLARMGPRKAPAEVPSTPQARAAESGARRVDLDATELRLELLQGEIRALRAHGGVSLRMDTDQVDGETLSYDSVNRTVRVDASPVDWRRRPATIGFGPAATRSEAVAQQLEIGFDAVGLDRLRLSVPPGDTGQLDVRLASVKTPGQVEWMSLTFWDSVHGNSTRIETQRVRMARRLRSPGEEQWSPPLALWGERSWIEGRNMLREQGREIVRAVAEGERTTLQTGEPGRRIWAWGDRFSYETATGRARLTSRQGQEVTIQREGSEKNYTLMIEVDMESGYPVFMDGPRILWGPPDAR